jgi:hypothetical protein
MSKPGTAPQDAGDVVDRSSASTLEKKDEKNMMKSGAAPEAVKDAEDVTGKKEEWSFPVFNALKNMITGPEVAAKDSEDVADPSSTSASEKKEETKRDHALGKLVESARNRFISKRLQGSICISQLIGVVTSSVSCQVDEDDWKNSKSDIDSLDGEGGNDIIDPEERDLVGQAAEALSAIEAVVNALLDRSKSWDERSYSDKMSLSRVVSVGFYLPFFMAVGFLITVELTATVTSLSRCRRRMEQNKILKKALQRIDRNLVDMLIQQGLSQRIAIQAVMVTDSQSFEAALRWAVENVNNSASLAMVEKNAASGNGVFTN